MVAVTGHGGYVPLYRVDRTDVADQHGGRASGESAVPARDENLVSLAAVAAETALSRAGVDGDALDAVFAASVTDPFAEHGIAAHVAYRLEAEGDVRTGDFGGTLRASTDAFAAAHHFVEATGGTALLVAVDVMPASADDDGTPDAGAGAAALVLEPGSENAVATVEGLGQETTGFVERHREHGEVAVTGDERFERRHGVAPAASAAIERSGADPDRAVAGAPDGRMANTALGTVDADHVSTFGDVGHAGTASPLLDLVHAFETGSAGESVLLVVYGTGGADAVSLSTGSGVDRNAGATVEELLDAKEQVTYAKHLEYRERVEYEGT
jgi:3-hydroxy-3-methylglutaryl CoA synthase